MEVKTTICLLIIYITLAKNSANAYHLPKKTNNYWLQEIWKETKHECAIIWTHDFKQLKHDLTNEIVKVHSNSTPTGLVDATKFLQSKNVSAWHRELEFLQQTTKFIHVIILKETKSFLRNCDSILLSIKELNEVSSRSKVLIIVYGKGPYRSLPNYMKNSLLSAWNEKFLDLTLIYIQLKSKSRPIYIYYQPFEEMFHEKYLSHKSTIFPDKLKDLKAYRLTIANQFKADESNKPRNIVEWEESRRYGKDF